MFQKDHEEYLIRRLQRNDVVLFLGAGFSMDATNLLGERFPSGKELCQKIWTFIGMEGTWDGTELKLMYEALIRSSKKKEDISRFMKDIFTVKSFPDEYNNLSI